MPSTPYLTTADVAQRLTVTAPTVRRLVAEEGLPAHRVARSLKFTADEVDAWVRTRDASDSGAPAPRAVAGTAPSSDWVAEQVARFTPEDLRRAAEVLLNIASSLDTRAGAA